MTGSNDREHEFVRRYADVYNYNSKTKPFTVFTQTQVIVMFLLKKAIAVIFDGCF